MIKGKYLFGNIVIVSHDAGGAEILASYVKQQKLVCSYILEGPAIKIFERHLGPLHIVSLEEGFDLYDTVICGTSGQSNLEWQAIAMAREKGKFVVSLLDHWINYSERFERNGIINLPDEIWVCDIEAKSIAGSEFRDMSIKVIGNPYFADLELKIKALSSHRDHQKNNAKSALFVSENITDCSNLEKGGIQAWNYTEFDAIEFFLSNMDVLKEKYETLVIRPHPSDSEGKYDVFRDRYPELVTISNNISLLDDIIASNLIVGCQSMAMVVGLVAKKKVISVIPPCKSECELPHQNILMLRDII